MYRLMSATMKLPFKSLMPRSLIAATLLTGSIAVANAPLAYAQDAPAWQHGISLFGEVKYPEGFPHFDYVNVNAPKGGTIRLSTTGTFDTLNPFNLKGTPAAGAGIIYDTLMASAMDEASTEYGLIAASLSHPDDFSSVTYKLRPEARWHDGKEITADDVIFSLNTLRKSHPFYNSYYKNIASAEALSPHEVKFTFDQKGNRELPQITGQLVILPKHFWEGTDKDGKKRDFFASTLEAPLGAGAYKVGEVKPGRSIAYERVEDYWATELNVNVGQNNFDEIRYEYFRDLDVRLEGFKGDAFDFISENSAKRWATGYDFPAVKRGDVTLQNFRTKNAEPMQGFVLNTRQEHFKDRRVRRAFDLAYDFEWMNENVFFGQYQRITSYFENTELAATGLPDGRELEILNEIRDLVPAELFTSEYETPVNGDRRKLRANLKKARGLLEEAGWVIKDGKLVNSESGKPMSVEFMIVQAGSERVINPYRKSLERLGITSKIRVIDTSQYRARLDDFDFDIVTSSFGQSLSPGNEQRDFWGSDSADRKGSRNVIGIKNPAVDKLIDKIIFAKNRADLVAATRALDRVLLWNHYIVPQFFTPNIRTARWDRFGLPEKSPDYAFTYLTWWWDEQKAAAVKGKQ